MIEKIEQRKYVIFVVACLVIFLAAGIRMQAVENLRSQVDGRYLPSALDPFYFQRVTQHLIDGGRLSDVDEMRYLAIGEYSKETVSLVNYYLFSVVRFFKSSADFSYFVVVSPVVYFAVAMIVFYFMVMMMMGRVPAVIATMVLSLAPQFVGRTNVGFADHEAIGVLALFLAMMAVMETKKVVASSRDMYGKVKWVRWIVVAPVMMVFLMYSWGGMFKIFMVVFSGYYLAGILLAYVKSLSLQEAVKGEIPENDTELSRLKKGDKAAKFVALIGMFIFYVYVFSFFGGYGVKRVLNEYFFAYVGWPVVATLMVSVVVLMIETEKVAGRMGQMKRIKVGAWVLGFLAVVVIAILAKVKELGRLASFVKSPMMLSRVGVTVAENQPVRLTELSGNVGVFFTVVFVATGMIIIGKVAVRLMRKDNRRGLRRWLNLGTLREIDVLIFVMWMMSVYLSVSSVRMVFVNVIFLSFFTAYVVGVVIEWYKGSGESDKKLYALVLGTVMVIVLFNVGSSYVVSKLQARQVAPSANVQWQNAMKWVQENTDENARFVSWWDYGYWIQTLGERRTVTDGGHVVRAWDHLIARYLLTTTYDETAKILMKSYNASYLVLDPSDVGKYSAFSSIADGEDEEGKDNDDRVGYIAVFRKDVRNVEERKEYKVYHYYGQQPVDEDVIIGYDVFPKFKSAVVRVDVKVGNDGGVQGVEAVLARTDGYMRSVKVGYVAGYDVLSGEVKVYKVYGNDEDGKYVYEGVARFVPDLNNGDAMGAIVFLTPKVKKSLFARFYVLNNVTEGFEKVYSAVPQMDGVGGMAVANGQLISSLNIYILKNDDDVEDDGRFRRRMVRNAEFDDLYEMGEIVK